MTDPAIPMLRHTLATLAYRAGKALRDVPPEVADFGAGSGTRTPRQILSHMGDLFDWALSLADGQHIWKDSMPLPWREEVARFFAALETFDKRLASGVPLGFPAEKIFQGPIADAQAHVGQITILRRLAGAPVRAENYFRAEISAGRVGADQAAPVREF